MARSRRSDEPAPDGAPTPQEGADQAPQAATGAADDGATAAAAEAAETPGATAPRGGASTSSGSSGRSAGKAAAGSAQAAGKSAGASRSRPKAAKAAGPSADRPTEEPAEKPAEKPAGRAAKAPDAKVSAAKTPAVGRTPAPAPAEETTAPPAEAKAPTADEPAARRTTRPRRQRTTKPAPQRVAVVIPCKDESRRIAATVRAARAIPHVDLVLVVDDGSEDATQHVAREAGAVVVRHSHNRGKAAAMETGAAVVAMRDVEDGPARLLLFIDGDIGESAVNAAPLVPPVLEGEADATIALLPPQPGAGGRGIVVGLARRSIQSMTGWTPTQPLSGMRCLTREAFEAATPLARGWGVETGMTIDLLSKGFRIREVPCGLRHRPSGSDLRGQLHRAAQYRDVLIAVNARRARRLVRRGPRPGPDED